MIEVPRSLVRSFRAVLRHSSSPADNQRELPVVVCRAGPAGLAMEAVRSEMAFRCQVEGARPEGTLAFSASLLAQVEGRKDDPVTLERINATTGKARWEEGGSPHLVEFALAPADAIPPFPDVPRRFTPMPPGFGYALAEAIRTTARDSVRYALTRVQLRGKEGALVASDGHQLLLQTGFPMPWGEDLLIPAIPALAAKERMSQEPIGLGRTKNQVALRRGAWTFLLLIDREGKFPEVENVIPKALNSASRLRIDPQDKVAAISMLAKLSGKHDEFPVTIDLGTPPALRFRMEDGPIQELALPRSTVVGKPMRVASDRRFLLRALQLHCEEICVPPDNAALWCREEQRTYVWMSLDKASALPASADVLRVPPPLNEPPKEPRRPSMPAPTTNGHLPHDDRRGASPPSDRPSLEELIAEAEALRAQLSEAAQRSARLVGALKQQRRHSRVLRTAIDSLRELRLGP